MDVKPTIKEYWEKCTPMAFGPEKWSYEKKRSFRYGLQDYMHDSFRFEDWSGKRVLEIGCGAGIDTLEFARNGAIVTAVDMTDNAVKLTTELAKEAGLKIEVHQAPATKLPFKDSTFDCVYSYGVLHHIPDVEVALGEISRVLKKSGKIMLMLYNRDSLLYAYSIVYRHGIREGLLLNGGCTEPELVARYSERVEGCPYTRAYTRQDAKEVLSKWFDDIEVTVRYNVIDTATERKVKLGLDDKWELGWHLIVKATRNTPRAGRNP